MRRHVYSRQEADAKRLSSLQAAAEAFVGFRPAADVFVRVRAVPTIFPQYDHGVRVGGHPTERITLVHGVSGEGKTKYTLGLSRSFLAVENPVLFVDAERTLEAGFVRLALGDYADSPVFFGSRPTSYEATRVEVRGFCNRVAELRRKKKIHADSCGLVIVDSIRKLVPEDQWKKILELSKSAEKEKARDRLAQIKAMMNAAWCDELVPLLEQTGCTMAIIARDTEDTDAPPLRAMPGRPPPPRRRKTGGGSALYYDASLDVDVSRARFVTKKAKEEGERPTVYGERHRITIKKSKVSGKEDTSIVCYFHWSNGVLVPEGFDRARDLVELGLREGVIKGGKKPRTGEAAAGWMQWGGQKWQGEHAAVKKLHERPDLLEKLERDVRAKFKSAAPIEVTPDGEVIED